MGKELLKKNEIACFALAKASKTPNNREITFEDGSAAPLATTVVREISNKLKAKDGSNTIKYFIANETEDIRGISQEKIIIAHALRAWEYYIPLKFTRIKNEEQADIKIYFRTDDPYWKDRPSVLAYAGYPEMGLHGIVVFNDKYMWSLLGEPVPAWTIDPINYTKDNPTTFKTYILEQTLRHEFGHTLGLPHDKIHSDAVLGPFYSVTKIRLDTTEGSDVDRIQKKYGKRRWISQWRMWRWRRYIDAKLKKYND